MIDVGKLRLDLPWNAFYEKELDVRFSRSYGPGRYDENYELGGVDYPAGYVRWTERRNLQCFVDMLAGKQLPIESLISGVYSLEDAPDVYQRIHSDELRGVGFLFGYPDADLMASAACRGARWPLILSARVAPPHDGGRCGSALSAPATTPRRCFSHI